MKSLHISLSMSMSAITKRFIVQPKENMSARVKSGIQIHVDNTTTEILFKHDHTHFHVIYILVAAYDHSNLIMLFASSY